MIDPLHGVSPENWDVGVVDGQPVEMVSFTGLLELIRAYGLTPDEGYARLAPLLSPEHAAQLADVLGVAR